MVFFDNILLYYNNAFIKIQEQVIRLVRSNQAQLTIIDVFDNFDQYLELLPPSSTMAELKGLITSERRHEIKNLFKAYPDLADKMTLLIKFGNPVVETIKESVRGRYDLVIKAASGDKNISDRLFGNIAVKLLRKCPCPVLVIKPSESSTAFQKILVPVDPDTVPAATEQIDRQENLVCNKLMDIALSIAQTENSHLDILHCWFLPGESMLASGRIRIDPEKLSQMKTLAEKIHTQKINTLIRQYDLSSIPHSVDIKKGEPADTIIEYAKEKGTNLIIMGTIGRSGLAGLLIGNTAEKIIEQANCSVLTIKPSNFKSPIKL